MIFRFRPHVQYQDHDQKLLHLVVDRIHRFIDLPEGLAFDYSKFSDGVDEKSLSGDMKTHVEKSQLFELLATTDFEVPEGLSFLRYLNRSQVAVEEHVDRLKKTTFEFINLMGDERLFSILAKHSSVLSHSSWLDFIDTSTTVTSNLTTVVLTDSYQTKELTKINAHFIYEERSWLLVCQDHRGTALGPYFDNTDTQQCFECFLTRIRSKDEATHFERKQTSHRSTLERLDFSLQIETSWLELELMKDPYGKSFFDKKIFCFDSIGGQINAWNYLPYPLCKTCKP